MAITINGSGTVTGLSVGGLPDGTVDSGTLATDSVTAAKLEASAITGADLPAGSVIQVVSELNTSALLWTDGSRQTAVTKSITVQEGNKVLMNFVGTLSNGSVGTGVWSDMAFLYLYQDSSSIRQFEHDGTASVNGSNHRVYNVSGSHLTGALSAGTYAFSLRVDPYEANSFEVNRDNRPSSMILMEIQV